MACTLVADKPILTPSPRTWAGTVAMQCIMPTGLGRHGCPDPISTSRPCPFMFETPPAQATMPLMLPPDVHAPPVMLVLPRPASSGTSFDWLGLRTQHYRLVATSQGCPLVRHLRSHELILALPCVFKQHRLMLGCRMVQHPMTSHTLAVSCHPDLLPGRRAHHSNHCKKQSQAACHALALFHLTFCSCFVTLSFCTGGCGDLAGFVLTSCSLAKRRRRRTQRKEPAASD